MGTFIKAVFKGKCLITFDDGDPSNADTTKEVPRGTTWGQIKADVTAPSKTGHTFKHWSTTQDGDAITDTYRFMDSTVTIYAVFEIIRVTISFNPDGGSPTPDPKTVDYGTTWGQIKADVTAPSKTGHTFLGWEVA